MLMLSKDRQILVGAGPFQAEQMIASDQLIVAL